MNDENERDTETESQDYDLTTEGHVKPNMDPTGEIDDDCRPPSESEDE